MKKNITCKEINVENIWRAVKRQRTPSDCRDLLPRSPALDINTIPDIIQVCLHVGILTVGVMISQAGRTPGKITSPIGQPQQHADRSQTKTDEKAQKYGTEARVNIKLNNYSNTPHTHTQ